MKASDQALRILNFGSMNLDYVYRVPHFVAPGETLAAEGQSLNPGGKGLNQSIALARAGAAVCHAGCVGAGGEQLAALLRENGVDTAFLRPVSCLQGNAMIQVNDAGENCILLYGGSNRAVTREQVDETLAQFSAGDYLVLQNEISCLDHLVRRAAQRGMHIVLNPSPFEDQLRQLDYNAISWLLVNEVEARQLTGQTQPEAVWAALHSQYPALCLVLTLGSAGAVCFTPQETVRQPIFPVQAVDTTAAGDTFTGFFLAALVAGRPLAVCMRRAAMASALSVGRPGASCSIPTAREVEEALCAAGQEG